MKKVIGKILILTIGIVILCCNFCYADLITTPNDDRGASIFNPSDSLSVKTIQDDSFNIWPIAIIGIVITIIVVIAVVVLVKTNKNKIFETK